ncbi:hypothetical protein D3C80_1178150 [compost metagenome]
MVAQGCSGVFAAVGGYHHGRGDGFDPGARMYDHRGHDVGAVAAGAVLGAIIAGVRKATSTSVITRPATIAMTGAIMAVTASNAPSIMPTKK